MKLSGSQEIDYYRVQLRWRRIGPDGKAVASKGRGPRRPWMRTWQAEWPGCQWAPRAYTRRGIERRAERWYRRGGRPEWQIRLHRWVRRTLRDR